MARTEYYRDPAAPTANSIVVAVTAFIVNDAGRLLMIRRTDDDRYGIPGGAQEIGETISTTVIREVLQETGIDVQVVDLIGIYTDPEHVVAFPDGEVRQEFSLCFRARPVAGEARASSEGREVLWIDPVDLDDLDIHPSVRLRIAHGFEHRALSYYARKRPRPLLHPGCLAAVRGRRTYGLTMKVAGVALTRRDCARCCRVGIIPVAAVVGTTIRDHGSHWLPYLSAGLGVALVLVLCALALVVIRRRDEEAGRAGAPPTG